MDEAKRKELYARREALLAEKARLDRIAARAEFVRMVPILSAIEDAGDDYENDSYRGLTGALNHWAHDDHLYPMRSERWADLPIDPSARDAAILASLRERLGEDDAVTIVLCRERLMLRMRMPVLVRHLAVLVANGEGDRLGFAAPPDDWIVMVHQHSPTRMSQIVIGKLIDSA